MKSQREKLKKFKVYYFIGDYLSSDDEQENSTVILARTESEAKDIFKDRYPNYSFGWIDEV